MTDGATRAALANSRGRRSQALLARLRRPPSTVAAYRALRATLVIPALFALTSHVLDNAQLSLFATFGGFATLVLASFAGNRPQKVAAHLALGVVGSLLIALATVTSSSPLAAALVALPVVFCVTFAGATGWNAANGAAAALLTYILPAASPGTVHMIPSRLAGWWLATGAGTLAVLVLSPRPGPNRLRTAATATANVVATELDTALAGVADPDRRGRIEAASRGLAAAFTAAPYRPTGLAIADQAVARLIESLQWCASLVVDLLGQIPVLSSPAAVAEWDRRCFAASVRVLRDVAAALGGSRAMPAYAASEGPRQHDLRELLGAAPGTVHQAAHAAFYASVLAEATRAAAASARIVNGETVRTIPGEPSPAGTAWGHDVAVRVRERFAAARHDMRGQMSLRSVWVRNGARAAVAIAAAIAIADLTDVQHGFWVVLGTLSVLRTNAASTGANAWWAVLGTVTGVLIGAGLVLAIGVGSGALWAAFVLAILVAAYAPGVLPFPVGQAAFSVLLLVLYNLIAPAGWKVGVVRLEDIGIGAGVSAVVGVLFWPRGAVAAVADDVADALHRAGVYLVRATSWALTARATVPDGMAVAQASERLDDATRSLLAEQSAKRTPKEEVWTLVGGIMRLRLTGASLAGSASPDTAPAERTRYELLQESVQVAGECDELAATLGRVDDTVARELARLLPRFDAIETALAPRVVWVREHLEHAHAAVRSMAEPANAVVEARRTPWWK